MRTLRVDLDQVRQHLQALAPTGTRHIIALIPEAPGAQGSTRHVYGTLAEFADALEVAQRHGCGVFVAVNAMRGTRRLKGEVAAVRAVWCERDEAGAPLPLAPSLRIRTSAGRGHEYLLTDPADPLTPDEAERVNRQIAVTFGGDRQATDLARVLRLAGSWHLKGDPHRVEIIGGYGEIYGRDRLLAAFPAPLPAERARTEVRMSEKPRADRLGRYVAGTVGGILVELTGAQEGQRNSTLNRCAFRLGQVGLGVDEATEILTPTALAIGLSPHEVTATIRSGCEAGAKVPRLMHNDCGG